MVFIIVMLNSSPAFWSCLATRRHQQICNDNSTVQSLQFNNQLNPYGFYLKEKDIKPKCIDWKVKKEQAQRSITMEAQLMKMDAVPHEHQGESITTFISDHSKRNRQFRKSKSKIYFINQYITSAKQLKLIIKLTRKKQKSKLNKYLFCVEISEGD